MSDLQLANCEYEVIVPKPVTDLFHPPLVIDNANAKVLEVS